MPAPTPPISPDQDAEISPAAERTIRTVRLWNAPIAVVLGLAFGLLGTIIVAIVGSALGSDVNHPTPAVDLVSDVVFDAGFVAAALYLSFVSGRARAPDFGYRRISWRTGLIAFFCAGIGYYLITLAYGTLLNLHGSDKLPSELGVNHHTAALVGAAVFVCVIAPMAEEFFFRGFFFGTLRQMRVTIAGREVGVYVAALITAILFGLAHTGSANPEYLVPLGLLGFVLCMVRLKTRSLYPCMALHSVNNSLALGVNQEHWGVLPILGLMAAALAVITVITGPLSRPSQAD